MVRLGLFAWNTNSTVSSWEGFHRPPPLDRIFNTKTRAPDTTQATTPGASLVMNFPGIVAALSRVNQMGVVSGEPPPPGTPPTQSFPRFALSAGKLKGRCKSESGRIDGEQRFGFALILPGRKSLLILFT